MWDVQPTDDGAGPPVDVELADGQVLQAALVQRRQDRDGSWWYRVRLAGVWSRTETADGTLVAEPDDIVFDAPATAVRPHPGLEHAYASVPTWRHPAWLRRQHRRTPPASWDHPDPRG